MYVLPDFEEPKGARLLTNQTIRMETNCGMRRVCLKRWISHIDDYVSGCRVSWALVLTFPVVSRLVAIKRTVRCEGMDAVDLALH